VRVPNAEYGRQAVAATFVTFFGRVHAVCLGVEACAGLVGDIYKASRGGWEGLRYDYICLRQHHRQTYVVRPLSAACRKPTPSPLRADPLSTE
jgi:hypothetical protein